MLMTTSRVGRVGQALKRSGAASFSPSQIPNLVAWYDAADVATISQTGGFVSQWNDKSGNNYHFLQANGSAQPQTGVNTINGRNVITCSMASGTRLDASALAAVNLRPILSSSDLSVFGVYRPTATMTTGRLFTGSNGASATGTISILNSNILVSNFSGSASTSAPSNRTDTHAFSVISNGSSQIVTQNDTVTQGTSSVGVNTQNNGPFMFRETNNLNAYDGDFAELIIVSGASSQAVQNQVRAYFASKWGLTWPAA